MRRRTARHHNAECFSNFKVFTGTFDSNFSIASYSDPLDLLHYYLFSAVLEML